MDALITEAKNGDKEAFVRLIRMNKQSLYKTAWIYLRDEQDIADALQNTILSCYENIQRLREPKYFKTWLMRILINECKDILRQKNHAAELDDFAEGVHCEELNLCEWKQLLLCLDEESRKIVELYYFDEFSVKEISALLEMNSNTVSILNSPDEKTTGALSKKTDGERTKNSGNKKKIIRILLPVAAILGVSTGVLATNIGRLYKELEQQGVAEQEAAQMVVTEPESTAENVENITSYPITPEAVDWNQSMLTVKEAYFDGGGLSFVGEPSNEAKNYMITCRDHATVNGKDALASLNKMGILLCMMTL